MKEGGTMGERGGGTVAGNGTGIVPIVMAAGVGAGTGTRTVAAAAGAGAAVMMMLLEGGRLAAAGEMAEAIDLAGVTAAAAAISDRGAPGVTRFREREIGVGVRSGAARVRGRGGRRRLPQGEDDWLSLPAAVVVLVVLVTPIAMGSIGYFSLRVIVCSRLDISLLQRVFPLGD